jgi:hypothetical protein
LTGLAVHAGLRESDAKSAFASCGHDLHWLWAALCHFPDLRGYKHEGLVPNALPTFLHRGTARHRRSMYAVAFPTASLKFSSEFAISRQRRPNLRIPTKSPGHSEMMSPGVPT